MGEHRHGEIVSEKTQVSKYSSYQPGTCAKVAEMLTV